MFQLTDGDQYYDENWNYILPYAALYYGTVAKPGATITQAYPANGRPKGSTITVQAVPEEGVYPVTYEASAQQDGAKLSADPNGYFFYWPTVYRTEPSIVPVLPDRFRLTFATATNLLSKERQKKLEPLLDAMVSIYSMRVGPIVSAANQSLDEAGYDAAKVRVTHALVQAVSSIWLEFLHGGNAERLERDAKSGLLPISSSTIRTENRRSGGWNTLEVIRYEADMVLRAAQDSSTVLSKILTGIVREPETTGDKSKGRGPGDIVRSLVILGVPAQNLEMAANLADMLWARAARSETATPAAPAVPAAAVPVPVASSVPPPVAASSPIVSSPRSAGPEESWAPLAVAALGGVAAVLVLSRLSRH